MDDAARALLLAIGLSVAAPVTAKDLGVQGATWTVIERDIRQDMIESAARVDWAQVQDQAKTSGERYLSSLPTRHLPVAERTDTVWTDPSVTVTSDIKAPVKQADGSYQWQVIVPKGTRVNPLDSARPPTAMLFFDGSDPRQLELVRGVLALEPNRIVPVEAGAGNLLEDNQFLGRGVFHAQEPVIQRFEIRYLPSLLYAGSGMRARHLGLTSFAAPFRAEAVVGAFMPAAAPTRRGQPGPALDGRSPAAAGAALNRR